MKKFLLSLLAAVSVTGLMAQDVPAPSQSIRIFDEVIFFDGYNTLDKLSEQSKAMIEDDGVLRHLTSLYAVKLSDEQLNRIGEKFLMKVEVGALCDNYDRIGNINLALVPKGAVTYNPDEVKRLELGRFITPFMNKNKQPDHVPYEYEMDHVALILRDSRLRENYDFWVEFELFGIPYAANEQVKGCAGRQDVFTGTLDFVTDETPAPTTDNNVLVPIVIKIPENKGHNFNNYDENCTDRLKTTVKTWKFTLDEDVNDGLVALITSNHGANSGGEEYNRREHFVYFDGKLVTVYTPGRSSCEPFRVYNTQPNGIYGYNAMSDEEWQSFSNWCPGDKIDNRILHLGAVAKGEHAVKIRVRDAKFVDKQGDIPVSMYFQGVKSGNLPGMAALEDVRPDFRSGIKVEGDRCIVSSTEPARELRLYDVDGTILEQLHDTDILPLVNCRPGVNIVVVEYFDGLTEYHKIMR